MMDTFTRLFRLYAWHFLDRVPQGHPCSGYHGHRFEIELTLKRTNPAELSVYAFFKLFKRTLLAEFEGRCLNQQWVFEPTLENLAFQFFTVCAVHLGDHLLAVRVSHEGSVSAEYRRPDYQPEEAAQDFSQTRAA